MTKTLKLQGLNCASCATKIESKIKEISWVKNVNLNFTTNSIIVELKNKDKYSLKLMQSIIDDIEFGVKILDSNTESENFILKNNLALIKLIIAIPLFISGLMTPETSIIKTVLLLTSYLISGYDVLFRAFRNIIKGRLFDEFFLMTIATIGAFAIGESAEGVGVMIFFQLGEYIQSIAVGKTKKSIKALMSIKPDFARDENGKKVNPEKVSVSRVIEVRPGEKIPLDGIVISGTSTVDTKVITGESIPRNVINNDKVLSGFINISGILKIKVTKKFKDSTISKILEMVQNESSKKTQTENFITKFSKVYTPIVVTVSILIASIGPLIIGSLSYNDAIYKALIFLVISCPCALVISVPLGYFGGIGRSTKEGILVKGSIYLDALTQVTAFAFDKTGTLTEGIFSVSKEIIAKNSTREELIRAAAITQSKSNHPVAIAVTEYINASTGIEPESYKEISGRGVIATYDNDTYISGNKELMVESGIIPNIDSTEMGTRVYVAKNSNLLGVLILKDKIKEDSPLITRELGNRNVYMLTGDNREVAEQIAKELDIKQVKSELLPQDKADFISKLSQKEKVLFVGDGINDAPVLASSHVGISMGAVGSDVAIEASDIVFMNDKPSNVPKAIKIAKYTKRVIIENIVIALGFKIIIMILGLTGFAGLWLAVFADVGVTLIAVINSLKILRKKVS